MSHTLMTIFRLHTFMVSCLYFLVHELDDYPVVFLLDNGI